MRRSKFRPLDKTPVIRRVHENEIEPWLRHWNSAETAGNITEDDPCPIQEPAHLQILIDDSYRRTAVVDENGRMCMAAQCFNAECAGTGKQVQHHGIRHPRSDDIEDRLPQSVGCRPNRIAAQRSQIFSSQASANNAQMNIFLNR